jgi:hypothetical protein
LILIRIRSSPAASIAISGSPKTTNRLPAPVQLAGRVQIGVHARLQDRDAADPLQFGGVRIEIERASDHDVEPGIGRLARRVDEIGARHRAEFGAEKDCGATLAVPFEVAAFGADQIARPRRQRRKGDAVLLVRLLHTRCLEVFEHQLREIVPPGAGLGEVDGVDEAVILVDRHHPVRRQALDRERACDADARIVGVGLVVEIFELGLGGDRGVDLLLSRNPRCPPIGV